MGAAFEILIDDLTTMPPSVFALLKDELTVQFKGTPLQGAEITLLENPKKNSFGINIRLVDADAREANAWRLLAMQEGKKRQFTRGIFEIKRGMAATPPDWINSFSDRVKNINYGFNEAVEALTRNGYSQRDAFIDRLKQIFEGTPMEYRKVETTTDSTPHPFINF